ncbi:calmodulin calcium-dependent NAD kinase-like isoform X2 [Henckelia pumila]|uniref:calmodulin calcium-dependent NAD kinase-like isoform X2 n=1 Tax=Henckelia pumila TaxID=405737 RepID=UPI003C6E8F35
MHGDGGYGGGGRLFAPLAATASIGLLSAVIIHLHRRKEKPAEHHHDNLLAPLLDRTGSGRLAKIERFSHYLARQMGFEDGKECPQLIKLADEYLKRSKGVDEKIYEYLNNEANAEELYVKLVEEFERCIVGYFAFHWSQAPVMINQVLSADYDQKRLKNLVLAATRFDKITKNLKVTRVFSTLVEEMKAIGNISSDLNTSSVMAPVALSERCPVLLLMGGGMGAGKSTVLKDIMKEPFWSGAAANAVVVEADAFKETDVIYKALSSSGHHGDMLQTAELVHQSSTDAASSLLVTALNEGRDVIMDGTLSWIPFVEQTITMARNVHKHRYRMGEGYKVADDGTVIENYWVPLEEDELGEENMIRKPYRIELVGVICDAYLAVVRGIRRAIQIGRAVRVNSQLKSHKRFASAFPRYCELVDNARLYCTNAPGGPPRLIAWKDGTSKILVDTDDIKCLDLVTNLNDEAECIYELNKLDPDQINKPGSVWKDIVLLPTRHSLQLELKTVVKKIETPLP